MNSNLCNSLITLCLTSIDKALNTSILTILDSENGKISFEKIDLQSCLSPFESFIKKCTLSEIRIKIHIFIISIYFLLLFWNEQAKLANRPNIWTNLWKLLILSTALRRVYCAIKGTHTRDIYASYLEINPDIFSMIYPFPFQFPRIYI